MRTALALFALSSVCIAAEPGAANKHWAFQPIVRPAVPAGGHPLDAFLDAERARHGVKANGPADRRTLVRRVYLDLVGLPPTPEEVAAFLADSSPRAYESLVDRLLNDPRHGERWGRHWMDVWRYSDWDGYGAEVRNSQPHIWHWRDWIVESINADKGYDRMIQEMLAADELAPTDDNALRATGFLARNWFKFNRNIWLENTIEHTSKAFLGLTLNCARCHEHKYDPISQQEYFEFRAIFEPYEVRLDRVPGQPDTKLDGLPRVYDAKPQDPTYVFHRGDEAKPDKSKPIAPGLPGLFQVRLNVASVALPRDAQFPDRRDWVVRDALAQSARAIDVARQKAKAATDEARPLAETELAVAEATHAALQALLAVEPMAKDAPGWKAAATEASNRQRALAAVEAKRNLLVAEAERKAAKDKPKIDAADKKLAAAKEALAKADAALKAAPTTAFTPRPQATYPATSTGRRLALANWIASPRNPLTARVAVNHIWMRHFGKPLVPTVFDFGLNGQPPWHPALLDWLASEFMRQGWSMKAMHRLIVTSAAYQLDSKPNPEALAADTDNKYLWRFAPRRLEAEAVRDAVLHVSGRLDARMGGPDIDQSLALTMPRRSIYFRHSVEKYVEMLRVFDQANVLDCYRRDESIVPHQALALANNTLVLAQSRMLARDLSARHSGPAEFIAAAFERVLGRVPRNDESQVCVKFLSEQSALLADPKKLTAFIAGPACPVPPSPDPAQRARENLVLVLFNQHEFVTLR